jgi:hypothetical protein
VSLTESDANRRVRQRALIELVLQGASPERELKVAYSTARLDAFTNGAFTRMLRASDP